MPKRIYKNRRTKDTIVEEEIKQLEKRGGVPETQRHCRISYEEQLKVVYWIATYHSIDQIREKFRNEFGKEISKSQVYYYQEYKGWKSHIEKYREEFEARIADEELASKRRRIQEYSKLYMRLEAKHPRQAMQALSSIREEVEGKSSGPMSINQYNQYNGLSDEDLRKIIDENTRFLQIAEKRKQEITVEAEPSGEGN